MIRLVFFLAAALLLLNVQAQNEAPQNQNPSAQQVEADDNGPKIEFEQETIDYGTIPHNSNGVREFQFTNTGKEPLIIQTAKGSCGCTVPTWPKEPIAPGESGVIKVKYATNRVGGFRKTVTLKTNAAGPSKILTIKGKVLPKADPQQEKSKTE